jgi:hypothetical protein
MLGLLNEFYQERKVTFEAQLSFQPIGAFGGFRIQSAGATTMSILPPEEQREKRKEYKKEIDEFAKFLRDKFFAE